MDNNRTEMAEGRTRLKKKTQYKKDKNKEYGPSSSPSARIEVGIFIDSTDLTDMESLCMGVDGCDKHFIT